jgi:nitric oxide reductase subunit B
MLVVSVVLAIYRIFQQPTQAQPDDITVITSKS